ncbi:hypothetical protein ABVT39_004492 [Epinephelus coioides]
MAAAAPDDLHPLKRSSSLEWLPPHMSELRVVLLGNSWSQRSSVGNFILGETKFNTEEEPDCCLTERGQIKDKEIVLINTPDLLHLNISENKLSEHVENCVRLSDPGPHVFLLVLQPEDFTEKQKGKLDRILGKFSDRSFDHVLVLITTPREESSGVKKKYMTHPPLKDMIRMCRYRYLKQKNLERPELLTRLGQTAKENYGEHVSCDVSMDEASTLPADHQSLKQKEKQTSITDVVKAAGLHVVTEISPQLPLTEKTPGTHTSALQIVLLGKSEDKQTRLGNFITGEQRFQSPKIFPTKQSVAAHGEWRGKPLTVVKTPNIFSLSVEMLRKEMKNCLTLCHPGPNVLLLLVKPSEFTEENRQTLKFILSLFGQDAFKYSMVIMTHEERSEMSVTVNELLRDCGGRYYSMSEDNHRSLMERIEETANKPIRAALNLVLCGRRGAGKTSAAKAILGHTELHSVSSSSECVKHQGEVCARWVSLVELPALYGKPQEAVMEESFRCISLCDPEGVHAFILVLPVGPLTDEDKGELETIRNTFSSRVNDFTLILFTVESDPTAPDVVNFISKNNAIQELCQSCGGRYVVLNIKDQQQIPELLDAVEKMREMFQEAEEAIQKEVESILKEKEEEMKKQREELQRKHEEEMEAVKKRMEQQKADIEKERQLRDKQLKEMEENINKEREERKKEQEKREEDDRKRKAQEDIQQQDWEQKLDREMEQSKEEMKKQKENWEKERDEWWEKRFQENEQRRQEEQTRLKRLQEEYKQEREKHEKKRREEDRIRREQEEEERKELEENYKKKMEEMKRKYEEEARKQAEEFNEFRQKYTKDFTALVEKHMEEIQELKKRHERQMRENEESHDREYSLLQNLSGHKEKSLKEEKETLKKKHEQEIYELKQNYRSKCIIL